MSESVKRHYTSPVREERARSTRRAIVDAAARLFVERGYGATTIDAIAAEAGVSRKTVFTSVGGKVEALKLACDWTIVGDDEPVPMLERPQVKQAETEADPRRILATFAQVVCDVGARFARLHRVAEEAAGSDPGVHALAEEGRAQRLTGTRALATLLHSRKALRRGLTVEEAADVLWLYNDPAVYHRFVLERGWPEKRYRKWLTETLCTQLLRDP
jgi:AcrR family transcriptional regulator